MKRQMYRQNGEDFEPIEIDENDSSFVITYKGKKYVAETVQIGPGQFNVLLNGKSVRFNAARVDQQTLSITTALGNSEVKILSEREKLAAELFGVGAGSAAEGDIHAPMPGLILRVEVREGDKVSAGQPLLIMEAMKMENEIKSPLDGTVTRIQVEEQAAVEKDDLLLVIEN